MDVSYSWPCLFLRFKNAFKKIIIFFLLQINIFLVFLDISKIFFFLKKYIYIYIYYFDIFLSEKYFKK
jgi:hypothetical protein